MKKQEELDKYREMAADELRAEAARLRESLFRLNFKLALGEVDAIKRIRDRKSTRLNSSHSSPSRMPSSA